MRKSQCDLVIEWPEKEYRTSHLKNLKKDNRRLVIQIADPTWGARIQGSEGIALSQYESLMKEHETVSIVGSVLPAANNIFTKAINAAKVKNPKLNIHKYSNLKGFIQLITNYILRAQIIDMTGSVAKAAFSLMSRTNFASMYEELLSMEEKELFKTMLGDSKNPNDNPILTELEGAINPYRSVTLSRKSTFFYTKAGTNPKTATFGPTIYKWLVGITNGQDLLKEGGVSAAIGAKKVETTHGDKDFKLAQFEVRGSVAFGGNDQPVANWMNYIKQVFEAAAARKRPDIADDPTTPDTNEATKTSLKL